MTEVTTAAIIFGIILTSTVWIPAAFRATYSTRSLKLIQWPIMTPRYLSTENECMIYSSTRILHTSTTFRLLSSATIRKQWLWILLRGAWLQLVRFIWWDPGGIRYSLPLLLFSTHYLSKRRSSWSTFLMNSSMVLQTLLLLVITYNISIGCTWGLPNLLQWNIARSVSSHVSAYSGQFGELWVCVCFIWFLNKGYNFDLKKMNFKTFILSKYQVVIMNSYFTSGPYSFLCVWCLS